MNKMSSKLPPRYYEMPPRFRECFYLANASFFDSVNWYVHKAYEIIFSELVDKLMSFSGLDEQQASNKISNIIKVLDQCNSLLDIRYPLKKEDGSLELIRSFTVNHGALLGNTLSLGGLRISPHITRDEMKGLSVLSTHRLSALGIRATGAFGGLKINSNEYSPEEMKSIIKKYFCLERNTINTERINRNDFMIEPDLNSDETVLRWIYERKNQFCDLCTGDWLMKSGSQAAFFGLEGFLENQMVTSSLAFEQGISGKTFIIQGLGKMGANLATFLQSAGAKCVGVKEHDCHVFDKEGFNVHDIISHKKLHGTLKGFQLAKPVDDFEIYKEDCDILILAAKQKSIVCHMAKDIKAKLIVEAAYAPITPSAYMILRGHSKIIIPDIFICGGSAVGAYLEYCLSCNRRDSGLAIAEFYKNILDQLCSNDRRVVISKNSIGKIKGSGMEPDILTHALRILYRQKTQEMIDVALKYNLGYDFKTAAFLMSIRNIFDQILCSENIKL